MIEEYSRDQMLFTLYARKPNWSQAYIENMSDEELYKHVREMEETT